MEELFGTQHHVTLAQECAGAMLVFAYGFTGLRSPRKSAKALQWVSDVVVGEMDSPWIWQQKIEAWLPATGGKSWQFHI